MAISSTSFKSKTPLQDRSCELGIDTIMHCDDTLTLNERRMKLNSERDDLRGKRGIYIHNLYQIDKREREIDVEEDAINKRTNELEYIKKNNVRQINQITEETKSVIRRFEFTNCTVNIE